MPIATVDKAEWLGRVGLFSGVERSHLERVAELAGEITFPPGRYIVLQGLVGNGLYVIVSGRARVVRGDDTLAELGPGDFFGELSVIDQGPRLASVVAVERTTCLGIASWDLLALLEREPRMSLNLLRALATRLRESQAHHTH